jgi:hypothetical protein
MKLKLNFKKIMFLSLLNFIFLFIGSCNTDKKIELSIRNPVEYVYTCNIDSLKTIIKQNFNHQEFYGLSLGNKDRVLITEIFDNPANYNDFILEEFSTWHKCKSKVYYNKKNEPHIYHATYQLHLIPISENQTKVVIITTQSGIIYKTKLPVLPHFNRVNRLKELPPTTVEEYEILQIIGNALGVKDMPPLKIPSKIII